MKICLLGRTDTNKVVIFEGGDDLIDKTVEVIITEDHMWYLQGKVEKY